VDGLEEPLGAPGEESWASEVVRRAPKALPRRPCLGLGAGASRGDTWRG
jgi:hypothetical protein